MKLLSKILVAPSMALFLTSNLYSQDLYSTDTISLAEAIKEISEISKIPYIVDKNILKDKKANLIKDVKSLEEALNQVLKGTGLKAVISNNTIVITKEISSKSQDFQNNLGDVEVQGEWLGESSVENVKTYSGARTVIRVDELQKVAALNIEDALRVIPGVQIQDETGTGVLPNISIRGLSPRRSTDLNVLVNGIPAAIAPYSHTGFSLFPITMETIETIDVVRGGAAVHYGPNNVGGVLNFITKGIEIEPSTTLKNTTRFSNGNMLNDTYIRTGGFVSENLGLQLQYNTINGESSRDHSDTTVNNIVFDSEYYPNDNSELKFNLQYYTAKAELPGALLPDTYKEDSSSSQRPYDEFDGETTRTSIVYKINPSSNTEFHWMNFAQNSKRKFTWGFDSVSNSMLPASADTVKSADREINVLGTEPRFTIKTGNHEIIFGARYVNEDVDYISDATPFSTGVTTISRDWKIKTSAIAGYVSDTISFMDGDLNITPGLRYEKVNSDFGDNLSSDSNDDKIKNMSSFLPGLSIGYQASPSVFLFANSQKSLKSPQVAQVRKDGDLGAQLAWNYELGLRYDVNDMFSISSTVYRIDYKDQIEYQASTATFENLGRTRYQGLETQVHLIPTDNTLLTLGYTYLDTEQLSGDNAGNELKGVSTHQLSLSSDYKVGVSTYNLTGIYLSDSFSDSENTVDESDDGSVGIVPSYMLWNAKATTKVSSLKNQDTTLSFGINNLLDEEYYFRGVDVSPIGRVSGQGRTFIFSAQIDF